MILDNPVRNRLPLIVMFVTFAIVVCGSIVALLAWKAAEARIATLARAEIDARNLVHSLASHAVNAFQAADVATSSVVELLRFQSPSAERMDSYLVAKVAALPQLRDIVVLGADGLWRYSSLPAHATYSNADREYFQHHRISRDQSLRITELVARLSGRPSIVLTRRVSHEDGSFAGVVVATIDVAYFTNFYKGFNLGANGSVSLLSEEGRFLLRWPSSGDVKNVSRTELFTERLKKSSRGFYKITSPVDGLEKYFAYEQPQEYPLVVTVALGADEILASWRRDLRTDILVALGFIAALSLLATLIARQVHARAKMGMQLRDREQRYRLLADNIADIVILLDGEGRILYVSPSVESMGYRPYELIGASCFDMVHPEDASSLKKASHLLAAGETSQTVEFRGLRADRSVICLEAHFRYAKVGKDGKIEAVAILRDVTVRRAMEEQLHTLNERLSQLATTDGLTNLANRRTFDIFLKEAFEAAEHTSMLLVDIDHFKSYNDQLGHQAGDECIAAVAQVVADATGNTNALAARYGGEEFAVVLPGVTEQQAARVATAIRMGVRALQLAHPGTSRGFVAVSIGVANKRQVDSNPRALIADADMALYDAKANGRNCVVCASNLHKVGDAAEGIRLNS
jgi:diguanylate cyclase (GGDEF)-like protein/PAS domain S-box-containing protein